MAGRKTVASERKKAQKKTVVQRAVVQLRASQGMTQQAFATYLGKAINTVAVWETSRPPAGLALIMLKEAANRLKRSDLAVIFDEALKQKMQFFGDTNGEGKSRMV